MAVLSDSFILTRFAELWSCAVTIRDADCCSNGNICLSNSIGDNRDSCIIDEQQSAIGRFFTNYGTRLSEVLHARRFSTHREIADYYAGRLS